MSIVSYEKQLPLSHSFDVAVIGGGIAGVCAACAAADKGAKTILIERFAWLGGNGTSGGVGGFCGESTGQGKIFNEIIEDLEKFNAIAPHFYQKNVFMKSRAYNREILALVLQEITLRHNVKLLLHTRFVDAVKNQQDNSKLRYIVIAGKSGPEALNASFFVDCSGDADIICSYGGETMKGGPKGGKQLPMSINFFVKKGYWLKSNYEVPENYFKWVPYTKRSQLPMTSFGSHGKNGKSVKVKVPNFDATDTEQLTGAEIASHRTMMRVIDFYQKKRKRRWQLDYFAPQIGIREGKRVVGEYILRVEDLKKGAEFEDAIAVGTFPLDAHDPSDDKRTYILPKSELRVPPYHIPLRCLIPKAMNNVLVAGRNLSADQLALSSARVMTTCGMMGQAAGTTAAQCVNDKIGVQKLLKNSEALKTLQNDLEVQKVILDLGYYA